MRLWDRLWLLGSQAINALVFRGDPDESLSARAWRERDHGWAEARARIDWWLGEGHCQAVYNLHIARENLRRR